MRTIRTLAVALVVGVALSNVTLAQKADIGRTELARGDLGDAVREVIQVRVDFAPGAAFPRHAHPGVEVASVLEGVLEYQLGESPPVTLKAGESLFIPAGTVHSARNAGSGHASELATYVVVKGKPLVVPAQ